MSLLSAQSADAAAYRLTCTARQPGSAEQKETPVFLPVGETVTAHVEFVSSGSSHPPAAELVLAAESSVFRPSSGWLSDELVSRATVGRSEGGQPVYRFALPLAASEGACEDERSYCAVFGVVWKPSGQWLLDATGERARVRLPLYVRTSQPARADLLILAPHPDDEILCCSGPLAQALAAGRVPLVVVLTNGDSWHSKKSHAENMTFGRRRQGESLRALSRLGVPARQVLFLGYPDQSGFGPSRYTGRTTTYGDFDGCYGGKLDYRTVATGRPADCSAAALTDDLIRILQAYRPADVYLPVTSDTHPDHRRATRCLWAAARAARLRIRPHYWIAHAYDGDGRWPLPVATQDSSPAERYTPQQPLLPPAHYPPFDEDCPAAGEKRALLEIYQSQLDYGPFAHGYLLAFAKQTEGFWRRDISVPERYLRLLAGRALALFGRLRRDVQRGGSKPARKP